MRMKRMAGRLLGASALGLVSIAACAGAAAPAGAGHEDAWVNAAPGSVEAAKRVEGDKGDKSDAGVPPEAGAGSGQRCPYGELSDPHRGFIRCLSPDERDAGTLPPPSQTPPEPSPEPGDAGTAPSTPPPPPPMVEVGAPKFENGEVTKVEKSLNAVSAEIAKCVADHGGLSGASGSIKVQFLVRSRGRAEGVEVLSAKGVGAEAKACVRTLLKNKPIGVPSADPVGVTVTILLKAPAK